MKEANLSPSKSLLASKDTLESYSTFLIKKSDKYMNELFNDNSEKGQDQIWVPQWFSIPQGILSDINFNAHKFCSFCGQQVLYEQKAMSCYFKNNQRQYISHLQCIEESKISLSHNASLILPVRIALKQLPKKEKNLSIGEKQFFITVSVLHPLSYFTYFKSNKKLIFNGKKLRWDFQDNIKSTNMFEPNIICIPTSEFKLEIKVLCISDPQFEQINSRYLVDLSKIDSQRRLVSVQSEKNRFFKGQFEMFYKQQEKQTIIDRMNYKYKYNTSEKEPIVLLKRIELQLDLEASISNLESISIKQEQFQDIAINIISSPDRDIWGGATKSIVFDNWSPKSSQEIIQNPEEFSPPPKLLRKSQIDLPTYISTSNLKDYICTHNGSKQMQKTIQYMKPQEIDSIIHQLYGYFPQIVVHQYANYMFQSLIMTCSLHQRLTIIETLRKQFRSLICNKQGTFSMQQFIGFLTCEEQFQVIYSYLKGFYREISKDNYGTHFLRKLIKCFPQQICLKIVQEIINYTVELAIDKNSVCVLKALLKLLTNDGKQCKVVRKQLLLNISSRIDCIIGDQFGNYLIQQCFQLFPITELEDFNIQIVKNFKQYSVGVYSSNVILKCIKNYWKGCENFDKIDKKIKGQDISNMFRKKQGNKVLLQILERQEDFMLKIKIENMAQKLEQTKFNNKQWQRNVRNCKTDTVCSLKTFSDAVEQTFIKKGKYC